jgi:hypothetical protein
MTAGAKGMNFVRERIPNTGLAGAMDSTFARGNETDFPFRS